MRVVVPYVAGKLRTETIAALKSAGVEFEVRMLQTDDAYWRLFDSLWKQKQTFGFVEEDIVVNPDTIAELSACDKLWCAMPYQYCGVSPYWGLGCSRFSAELIKEFPDMPDRISKYTDPQHPRKHWCRLDHWLELELAGTFRRPRHHHEKLVHHLNGDGGSAHGCVARLVR